MKVSTLTVLFIFLGCTITTPKVQAVNSPLSEVKLTITPEKNVSGAILNTKNIISFDVAAKEGDNIKSIDYDQFTIRPVSTGNMYIKNKDGAWVSQNEVWSKMPNLAKNIEIKIINSLTPTTKLKFKVQNTKTARIYETNEVTVWNRRELDRYVNNINKQILAYKTSKKEKVVMKKAAGVKNTNALETLNTNNTQHLKKYLILDVLIFFVFVAIGFFSFNKYKNAKM